LKLWFVLRSYGLRGIQKKLREQIQLAQDLKRKMEQHPHFEILAPVPLNLICFRYKPAENISEEILNQINADLLRRINSSGRAYLSHTKLNGKYTLRMVIGQTYVLQKHVENTWELIQRLAQEQNTMLESQSS
jgi:aromatic-L-amino-acid decarboxylase